MRADARRNLDKIMEAVAQVVAEHGVNAPMEAIATRAGVGVGTLYRRFPDRTALIAALGRQHLTSISQALSDAADSTGDPWTAVRGFVTWVAESGRGTLAAALAGLPEDAVSNPEDLQQQKQRWQRQLDDLVHRAQADGTMRTDVTTEDLIHLLNAFTCHSGALPPPIAAQPAKYLQIMLDGLQTNPAPDPGHPTDHAGG